MSDFINNIIPYGTNLTPYYIGVGLVIWIIGLIICAKTQGMGETTFIFTAVIWSILCMFWPVLFVYAFFGGILAGIWRIFGAKP